jgi:drug efflux transport system permease protein
MPRRRESRSVPTTRMIDAARGVILRGAGRAELRSDALMLRGMATPSMTVGAVLFRKRPG